MKEKKHLPMYGVGPMYVWICVMVTIAGAVLAKLDLLASGDIEQWKLPCMIIGILMILQGIAIWIIAVVVQKVQKDIESNHLQTGGIYAWVRNPIYSGIVIALTGILVMLHNLWLLSMPVFFWVFMTVLMKATEEKWLLELYGKEYEEYCKKVNRCIPWFPRR